MSNKIGTYSLASFILSMLSLLGFAQNLGNYLIPFPNHKMDISSFVFYENEQTKLLQQLFPENSYTDLNFKLSSVNESLGAKHFTYQILYNKVPIEQALVKVHVDKKAHKVILVQTNLPHSELWNNLQFPIIKDLSNMVYLVSSEQVLACQKIAVLEEKQDHYAERFELSNHSYFENELKYHNDTLAYAKVFNPDPLTSASQVYGGLYQDAFTIDTSGLLIQNINNPGGTTVTANATNYTFDGQTFNIPTESYLNTFAAPILNQVFESIYLDGQGNLVGFNTAITENVASYVTQIIREDYNYPTLANEQVWKGIPVDFSGGVFNLSNDYFIISEFSSPFTNPAFSVSDSFNFNRSELGFEDANAFYHLNNYRNHCLSLGFTGLDNSVILIDAHGNNGADNSFFSPTNPPRLVFGQGGVDDAEDADVIIHEYGHAISNFASPGSNSGDERRALDEGFGDYLATSYSRMFSPFNSELVFSWDGHNEFWLGRISNSNKTKLALDANQNIYYNGEIWSATLMDLYQVIGGINTDKLAIEVMYYNMPNGTLSEAAENLFLADTLIFNGAHTCQLFDVLFARKFLKGTCTDFYSGLQASYSKDQKVQLLNSDGFANRNENLVLKYGDINLGNPVLKFINLEGKIVYSEVILSNYHEVKANDLASGIYFLELRTPTFSYRFKVMKN